MVSSLKIFLRFGINAILRRPPGVGLPTLPEDYGLSVSNHDCRERSQGVLKSFFTGVEAAVRSSSTYPQKVEAFPPLFQPFFWEGAAMGQSAARLLTLRRHLSVEKGTFSRQEPFALMRVVGVGFLMSFVSPKNPQAVARVARRFDNFGPLVQDGFGFGIGLFHWRQSVSETIQKFDGMTGFDRLSALNGLGRSLWFRFMDRPQEALKELGQLREDNSEDALALIGGLGLATAFTFPDELERGYGIAASLEGDEKEVFLKGMRIALFVRHQDQAKYLEETLALQSEEIRTRAREDLELALGAYEATHRDPRYIELFHKRCIGKK